MNANALNLSAEQRAALVAKTLADFRANRAEFVAALETPAAAELVLFFRKAGLGFAYNGKDGHVCGVLFATAMTRATAPQVTNGAGERAELMTRREAIEISLANLDAVIASIQAANA